MSHSIKSPRKLIEVALPLDAISDACQQEKNPFLKGHPRSFHLWWARRPLAAARAVLFAQLVNDPGYQQGCGFKYGKNKKDAAEERKHLFGIIKDLVQWKNITNEEILERARREIQRSWREVCELNKAHPQAAILFNPEKHPALHDPFAGGGTIPLEAQRLGLETYASDLNPVAVLINKAMIEIPPKFAGRQPVSLIQKRKGAKGNLGLSQTWPGATGLAEDVRHYGSWMRSEAQKRIGHLYPDIEITAEMARERTDLKGMIGKKFSVIAWLWARTVKSPNPAFSHVDVPLVSTFILGGKMGKEAYLEPSVLGDHYEFKVKLGTPTEEAKLGTKLARGANFRCIVSNTAIDAKYIRSEAQNGRMGKRLMAIVVDGAPGKIYISSSQEQAAVAKGASPKWKPDLKVTTPCHDVDRLPMYGMYTWGDAFTARQLVALTTFNDLIVEARQTSLQDAVDSGFVNDEIGLDAGGVGALAYSEAISVYLAAGVSQNARYSCTNCTWNKANENVAQAFGRQALPIVWDFAESNPLVGSLSIDVTVGWAASGINKAVPRVRGAAFQEDARKINATKDLVVFSTDPPYYDNIGYAELSEFFYVWLRPSLRSIFPNLFATIGVPKAEEIVAASHRHGSKQKAEEFFLNGMKEVMQALSSKAHEAFPVTIYYAFKQSETSDGATVSTGWETFLEAVLHSGFLLSGTWPMRTEKTEGLKGASNALASCIVLVCRKRPADALTISRREFIRELNGVLPEALDEMTKGTGGEHSPVAPVDLSQAIIGPGMAVFSKYTAVLEADGSPMSVRTALQLINRFLAEDDFDAGTQFCLHWFEQHGWTESVFGEADVLARSKSTSVEGLKEAGVLHSGSGKVRLLKWTEYPTDWDPSTDTRTPVWEALHQLIHALKSHKGEGGAGALLAALSDKAEAVRQLAYRLYTLCERLGKAEDARAYNELITSWTGIESAANSVPKPAGPQQRKLFEE